MNSDILSVFDETTAEILAATSTEAVSADTICEQTEVPKSTLYRRLDQLVDVGVLRTLPELSETNVRFFVYECRLDSLCLTVRDGEATLEATFDGSEESEKTSWKTATD